MARTKQRLVAAAISLGVLSGFGVAVPANAAEAITPVWTETRVISCSEVNFKGEARVTFSLKGNTWNNTWDVKVDSYRITRSNGQQGGNKANINLKNQTLHAGNKWNSPDSMKQDGIWRSLDQKMPTLSAGKQTRLNVEFIFDKSFYDPRCSVNMNIQLPLPPGMVPGTYPNI